MKTLSNSENLRKTLDEKRNELERCHQIIDSMIEYGDLLADRFGKSEHLLSVKKWDIDFLWAEIRKLQKGLEEQVCVNESLSDRLDDYRSYVKQLHQYMEAQGCSTNNIPQIPLWDKNPSSKTVQFSGKTLHPLPPVQKQYYCGLDTPSSGVHQDAGGMIHLGGWCCDEEGFPPKRVWIAVDDRSISCSLGWKRPDVIKDLSAKTDLKVDLHCGFNVEIESRPGVNYLRVWAEFRNGASYCLFHRTIVKLGNRAFETGQLDQSYGTWVDMFDKLTDGKIAGMQKVIASMRPPPLISVLLPTYNTDERWLCEAIESVRAQVYPHWQLCIADDASPKPHVKAILEHYTQLDSRICHIIRSKNGHISAATNSALELAQGSFCALLDHDDVLPRSALFHVADLIYRDPDADLIFSDEDKIDENGVRFDPYFKSDWNPELFLSHNCVSHLGVYRTSVLREIGGFHEDLYGSQDWDLAFRFILKAGEKGIRHIPRVLYHWRYIDESTSKSIESKPYAVTAGMRSIQNFLKSRGDNSTVMPGTWAGSFRVKPNPDRLMTVSIIIPDIDSEMTETCVQSILENTADAFFEILLVDDGVIKNDRIPFVVSRSVSRVGGLQPTNMAASYNHGASLAQGEVLLFLSPDTVLEDSNWLNELVSQLWKPEVGVSGAWQQFPDKITQSAGLILLDQCEGVMQAFRGLPPYDIGHMGRAHLIQRYSAVSRECFATLRSVFETLGGLDAKQYPNHFWNVDYCLRTRMDAGKCSVWSPYSKVIVRELISETSSFESELNALRSNWGAIVPVDPYFNPNLDSSDPRFFLSWPPRI